MFRRAILGLMVAIVGATGASAVLAKAGPLPSDVQAVRGAVARYHSYAQAVRDGYSVVGEPCVASPAGTMGFHAPNAALMADDAIDALRPEILLYVSRAGGRLELVGVEYWKADADGSLATADDRPSLFGASFDGPMPGHNPAMPVHYDRHVWLWETNPNGLFAPFNPAISC